MSIAMIKHDSEQFPYFLDNDITTHCEAMGAIFEIFRSIIPLAVSQFQDQIRIERISIYIDSKFIYIKDLLDTKTYLKCVDYFRFKLYLYIDYHLRLENYEQVHNMQELALYIFNKKFTLQDNSEEDDYEDTI